jgi:mannose-6-phosphate isomerase-like protein (cupin superfamily)
LQQLADECGLSQPFLSQLENGKAMPNLLALHSVARALDTNAHDLLEPQLEMSVSLVRAGDEAAFELVEGASVRFLVHGASHFMEPNEVQADPGVATSHIGHVGEEMIYVLDGQLRVEVDNGDPVELAKGDAYTFPATVPHTVAVVGTVRSTFLIISSPSSF